MRVLAWPAQKFRAWNPYTYLLYQGMDRLHISVEEFSTLRLLAGRSDIWHIHWPEHFLNREGRLQATVRSWGIPALMDAAHMLGTKIIWTTHNIRTHEQVRPDIEEKFWIRFTQRLDGFISLSYSALDLAIRRHPALRAVPGFVIPHGHFRDEYPAKHTKSEARRLLGIDSHGTVILNFGAIRVYKGISELISAFRNIACRAATLMIVGLCRDESLQRKIRTEAGQDPRVRILFQPTPAEDVQLYFAASDIVILPYKNILNSGSALLALSLNRPVCVPALGSMPELQNTVGDMWVRIYKGEFNANILRDALGWMSLPRPPVTPLDAFEWRHLRNKTVAAYREIMKGKEKLPSSVLQPNN